MHACFAIAPAFLSLSLRAGPGFSIHTATTVLPKPFAIRFLPQAEPKRKRRRRREEMPSPPRGRIMPGPTCCPTIKSLRAPWRFFEADVAWSGSGHLRGVQRSPSGVQRPRWSHWIFPCVTKCAHGSQGLEPGPGDNRILSARRMCLELIS
ncbi:hypothetical protein SORBI_3001G393101 [Sorghum bicolor]|uniref:Secreted protein n=1 Tax=Sorghum bicolor TaxID=4558 RepID=A0A1Z5S9U4_SORBI|nr:hypothetical protein SORBI_3001G393101 [Sorghum bicolor]OQU92703.1 hypothetical protein SORBI_3001G393101 [Sorghum bicolor]